MLKMTIDNEEVVSNKDISIKEEILSPSSTILNNVYPKEWENDKDYTSRFYYPKDYSKLNIQNFSVEPEEAGTTVEINENATINDVDTTKESRVISLKGQTSQTTYSGANLLPQDKYITTRTTNGITYTNNGDGTFSLTGTATANTTIQIIAPGEFNLESGQSYYLYTSKAYDGTTFNVSVRFNENGTRKYLTPQHTITPSGTITNTDFAFYIASGNTVSATNVKAMLVKGTSAPANYEPYVGGTASPNPSFPEPVNVVSGDNYINICGKNLLNLNNIEKGRINSTTGEIQYASNTTSLVVSGDSVNFTINQAWNGGVASEFIPVLNTTYRLSFISDKRVYVYVDIYDRNKNYLGRMLSNYSTANQQYNQNITITDNNVKYLRQHFEVNATGTYVVSNWQLEKGNTTTTFEPYIGKTYEINLGKNLFDSSTFVAGSIVGTDTTTRITSMQNLYLEKGTYTFSWNGISPYNFAIQGQTIGKPPLPTYPTFTLNSGWQSGSSYSFTITTPLWVDVCLRKNDNSTITINEISGFQYQIEKGSTRTSYSPYFEPIELCKIGTYQDKIYKGVGSNLFNINDTSFVQGYYLNASGVETSGTNWGVYYIPIEPNKPYTISGCQANGGVNFCWFDNNKTFISLIGTKNNYTNITSPNNAKYLGLSIVWNTSSSAYDNYLLVEQSSSVSPYEPYNAKDKWLLHKEIGKVVLDGSEDWGYNSSNAVFVLSDYIDYLRSGFIPYSNYYKGADVNNYSQMLDNEISCLRSTSNNRLIIKNTSLLNASSYLKAWLQSNPTSVYYVLATPTTTEITDNTLTSQLDNLSS